MPFDLNYYHFEKIDSTNTWALQNFMLMNKNGMAIVTANEQASGRGRQQRKWESPSDCNLYVTFCFFVNEEKVSIANIPQILALSCANVLESVGLTVKLKWPNDVLVNEKKIAGILCETKPSGSLRFIALGLGLNVNMKKDDFVDINKDATSILLETGNGYSVDSVLTLLEEIFLEKLEIFFKHGIEYFHKELEDHLYTPEYVVFNNGNKNIIGKKPVLNLDGSLSIDVNGTIKKFSYGEILTS